ncbi:transmembrane protein 209 [Vespula maculifrons]|uniref:Transmembrane protein 209 n=3 Tax=Vespula TaxID=7451 RepID=A0A834P9W4_VESPE|nr:transmembrane protein 209 [Vespula pensylvanica]XP_050869842.1 transmembrane protein 209 [Vespula vulgaris]KAF7407356.1 hypothetical protein HZH66_001893 [Vespula vulgaris]KAF7434132.1 hypothetical protein H0235_002323 [Vespula pensylvanica]
MGDFHSPMSHISPNARILTPKPQVQQTLHLKQIQNKARKNITWFFINSILLSIVISDILYGGTAYKPFFWIEWCLASIFALNAFYHITQYIWTNFHIQPIVLSPRQKLLLGISNDDPLFKSETTLQKISESSTPLNLSCISLNRRMTPLGSSLSESKDYSMNTFGKYGNLSSPKLKLSPDGSINKSLNSSMNSTFTSEHFIQSEAELQKYLKEASVQRKTILSTNIDQPSNLLSSFWTHPAIRSPNEVSPSLRRCAYQLAPTMLSFNMDKSKSTSPGAEEGNSPRGTFGIPDVWRKYRVDSNKVNEWTANLRMWISKTVVERVAVEIDNICSALIRHGLSDSQPGHIGLDRLRKLAQAQFLVSTIPTLPTLVPFLELSNNQEYLVKRIKTLAKGGSMSEFKWNSGGSHNSKEWDSSLPTDSAIIMHLIATYMDTQLEAPLDQPDARPFSSRYMARSGMDLPRNKGPIIMSQSVNPPHYCLALSGDSLPTDYEEIQRGRNNLFHTLLLFLYIVKTRDHGMLGRVNLGASGINILWVIDG